MSSESNGYLTVAKEDLIKLVQQNRVDDLKQLATTSPNSLTEHHVLQHAPTREMVLAIINYTPCGSRWTTNINQTQQDYAKTVKQSQIRHYFVDLVKFWPEVVEEILDDAVVLHGKSIDDRKLCVHVLTDILIDSHKDNFYHLEGPLYMSLTKKANLVGHIFTRVLCKYGPGGSLTQRVLYFLMAVFLQASIFSELYNYERVKHCEAGAKVLPLSNFYILSYLVLLGVLFIREVIALALYKKYYLADYDKYFKWAIITITPFSVFFVNTTVFTTSVLLVWLNFILSLRNARFFGKYILMVLEVLKTFLKLLLMFFLLLTCFTYVTFVNYYVGDAKAVLSNIVDSNLRIKNACFVDGLSSADRTFLTDEFDTHFERQFIAKTMLCHLSDALGNVNINEVTVNGGELMQNNLDDVRVVCWLALCVFLTIVFMNLLVGLTVGDVETIGLQADQKIMQIQIKHLYNSYTSWKLMLSWIPFARCQNAQTTKPNYVLYPNHYAASFRQKLVLFYDDLFSDYPLSRKSIQRVVKNMDAQLSSN